MNRSHALAACAVAVASLAAAAPAAGQGQGAVTLTANPIVVIFGNTTLLSGHARGGAAENAAYQIQSDPFPFDGVFGQVASGTTDAQGRYMGRLRPLVNTNYRTVVGNRTSRDVRVQVAVRVAGSISDTTPRRGSLVRFSGTVRPAHDGAEVRVQRRGANGRYRTIARTRLRDAGDERSRYSRTVRVRSSGVYRVLVVPGDGDHVVGVTRARRLRVHG